MELIGRKGMGRHNNGKVETEEKWEGRTEKESKIEDLSEQYRDKRAKRNTGKVMG